MMNNRNASSVLPHDVEIDHQVPMIYENCSEVTCEMAKPSPDL